MNYRKAILSSVIIISALCAAAYADATPARADENPYTPEPATSISPIDPATYCTIRPLGAIWTCDQTLPLGNGVQHYGPPAATPAAAPTPPKHDCEPKGDDTASRGGWGGDGRHDGFSRS